MLTIYICEDDERYRKMMADCIKDYIVVNEVDVEIALCTSDPSKIIDHIQQHKVTGLYFLDIELEGGYNGVEAAQIIRRHDPRGFIVFVTAHPRYLSLTFKYKVETLDYIHKGKVQEVRDRIGECIENAYSKHISHSDAGNLLFKLKSGLEISCRLDEILFFETEKGSTKHLFLHTKKRLHTLNGTLSKLIEELPFGFYQCHQSFIINVATLTESAIGALRQGECTIVMPTGARCHVSQRKKAGLLKLIDAM